MAKKFQLEIVFGIRYTFLFIPGRKTLFLDIEILKCNFVRLLNLAQDAAIIIIRKLKYGSMKNNQISIIFSLHSVFSVA